MNTLKPAFKGVADLPRSLLTAGAGREGAGASLGTRGWGRVGSLWEAPSHPGSVQGTSVFGEGPYLRVLHGHGLAASGVQLGLSSLPPGVTQRPLTPPSGSAAPLPIHPPPCGCQRTRFNPRRISQTSATAPSPPPQLPTACQGCANSEGDLLGPSQLGPNRTKRSVLWAGSEVMHLLYLSPKLFHKRNTKHVGFLCLWKIVFLSVIQKSEQPHAGPQAWACQSRYYPLPPTSWQ